MKTRLFNIILASLAFAGVVVSCAPKEDTYKKEIENIIVEAQVPLIQLESNFNGKQLSYQIENPNFYDSVKIAAGEATPKPAVFQAASLSKVVFAYIVMKMYDRGEIDLDTPICNYTDIDRFEDKESAAKLTARMVLNHRTGLPNWSTSPSSQEWPTSTITFKYPVDSCYGYSGEGFAYLQRAVEKIRGKKIDDIAREEQEALEERRSKRPRWVVWINSVVTGDILLAEEVKRVYTLLTMLGVIFFASIATIFGSLQRDMRYRELEKEIALLKERAIRTSEECYRHSSHSAILRKLKERGIDIEDPKTQPKILK